MPMTEYTFYSNLHSNPVFGITAKWEDSAREIEKRNIVPCSTTNEDIPVIYLEFLLHVIHLPP